MNIKDVKDIKLNDLINPYQLFNSREDNFRQRRKAIKSYKAKANAKRTIPEKFADWLTSKFGSIMFLTINVIWFIVWIAINTGMTSIEPFDEYPFSFLTMVVSLEAIVLSIVVLMSQNREGKIGELREEIDLQINTVSEEELTKLISLVVMLLEKQGINLDDDEELQKMLHPVSTVKLENEIQKELE